MACTCMATGVYVDNLIITEGDMEVLGRFKRTMSKNFKMSDLGTLNYYLGIEVQQSTYRHHHLPKCVHKEAAGHNWACGQ